MLNSSLCETQIQQLYGFHVHIFLYLFFPFFVEDDKPLTKDPESYFESHYRRTYVRSSQLRNFLSPPYVSLVETSSRSTESFTEFPTTAFCNFRISFEIFNKSICIRSCFLHYIKMLL